MSPDEACNNFLLDLIALQQDGRAAISAPTNWISHQPTLEVPTEIDGIIDELQDVILLGSTPNDVAHWHFFIGSPGNGKSAAMGKLVRMLISKGCQIRDEYNTPLAELEESEIPYALNVYEGNNKFISAQIVQDASVVRNPFSPDVDPAADLLETLHNAWDKKISLVVCTNRGVLEKAHRDNHIKREVNSKPWFKILAAVVSARTSLSGELSQPLEFDTKKKSGFKTVKVGYSHLDNRSLLLGRNIFAGLVQNATRIEYWESCEKCTSINMCPFKANRDWLSDEIAKKNFLNFLTKVEILSGQVIVFREALAIISLILTGCPRDYYDKHPCEWVRDKVLSDDFFALATRRIYMSLLSPYSPYGLESTESLRKKQIDALNGLLGNLEDRNTASTRSIGHVVNTSPPSTDVGVTRLLGEAGIITRLDPCSEALPSEFYDAWDSDFDALPRNNSPYITEIEKTCMLVWKELEENLEMSSDYSVTGAHWALKRWSSNFLLHLGALSAGYTAWAEELEKFASLLILLSKPEPTSEDKRNIRKLDSWLENLIMAENGASTVKLSESVTLTGQWVRDNLKPKVAGGIASGSVTLAVEFPGGESSVFAAPMYLWLTRLAKGNLDARCFPQDLLGGIMDARVRASAKGRYAFQNNDVELVINTGSDQQIRLSRFDGDIDVTSERTTLPENRE